MAAGDSKLFNDFVLKLNQGDYADSDVLNVVFISNTYASISSDLTNPQLSSVTPTSGGNVAASYTLANVAVTRSATVTSFTADNIASIAADAGNPTDVRCAVVVNDTSANDDLYKIYDLTADGSTPIDLVNNTLNFTFVGGELITATNTSA